MSKEAEVSMPVVRGSCLCGGVKYEITGPLMRSGHCHCSNCQSLTALLFAAVRVSVSKTSSGCKGRSWSNTLNPHPDFIAGFAASAVHQLQTVLIAPRN